MLNLAIFSFSYLKTPTQLRFNEHGGGFEFDCRCLLNPGRLYKFKKQTGLDLEVSKFLEQESNVKDFLKLTIELVEFATLSYKLKGYDKLTVGYGCTGGQHRSVYCAKQAGDFFSKDNELIVTVSHLQQNNL